MPESPEHPMSSPLESFERSASDAERMLRIAAGLADVRAQRMRADQKETLGRALKVRKAQWPLLERAEGSEAWVILKPNAKLRRDMFGEDALAPLTRQSVVVLAAAVETFVADCLVTTLQRMLEPSGLPPAAVESMFSRIRFEASSDPKKIKELFQQVGVENVLVEASAIAGFKVNTRLSRLAQARNKVAHGDAPEGLTCDAALSLVSDTRSVVNAIDASLAVALKS